MTTDKRRHQKRRGLGPIMGPDDFSDAIAELRGILSDSPTDDDREYVHALQRRLDRYEMRCGHPDQQHPSTSAIRRLRYMLEEVKQVTPEQAARETGIEDLPSLLRGHRAISTEENAILIDYFGCPSDSFSDWTLDD